MGTIETIHEALVQHGPHNDCIYLMRLNEADPYRLVTTLEDLARQKGYGKILARIPAPAWRFSNLPATSKRPPYPDFASGGRTASLWPNTFPLQDRF